MTARENSAAVASEALRKRVEEFQRSGFTVVRGLFGHDEIDRLCAEFAALRAAGPVPGHFEPRTPVPDDGPADPLDAYPRVMHPHEISRLARDFLLDARLRTVLRALLGEEVLAA
ncbi:phytanoyl-CoA dioxygenase family protein, partial [Streptomyces sp. NPDC001348]